MREIRVLLGKKGASFRALWRFEVDFLLTLEGRRAGIVKDLMEKE